MQYKGKWKSKLSDVFTGIAVKRLSEVETNPSKSHQHEFQGINKFRKILGDKKGKTFFEATYLYLSDSDQISAMPLEPTTWYDPRENDPKRSAEWRVYYPASASSVTSLIKSGDLLLLGKKVDGTLLIIIAEKDSTIENHLLWLFQLPEPSTTREIRLTSESDRNLDFVVRSILEFLGIEIETDTDMLEEMLVRFGGNFPSTKIFSEYARSLIEHVDILSNPDSVLITWLEKEETLFRSLERHIVSERLRTGFITDNIIDVDGFVSYSLSVQNRRKSRAGAALENHIEVILNAHGLRFCREGITENKSRPDFLFPGVEEYKKLNFDTKKLAILGSKSTCKDRWRQVLSEARRIDKKHLLTLEPSISSKQTDEMINHNLQLVVPKSIHPTYTQAQQSWLWNFNDFISEIKDRQKSV